MKPKKFPSAQSAPVIRVVLTLEQVCEITGLGKDTVYRLIREGKFPAPIKVGIRAARWIDHEVEAYIDRKIAERDAKAATATTPVQK